MRPLVDAVPPQRWRILALVSIAELLAMSLWFSGSAVVPALRGEWNLSDSSANWLTIAVQLGFVCGTLLSAFLNLPDIISARYLVAACALAGAATNATFGYYAQGAELGITMRFLTGVFLAGVYPPGMKIMASWFRSSRGTALGFLVGALTLGKASPYLINGLGSQNWRHNIVLSSLLAAVGALIMLLFVGEGPFAQPAARFDWKQIVKVFSNRGVRLANFGYFGHMWELYAMWAWVTGDDSRESGCAGKTGTSGRSYFVSSDRLRRHWVRSGGFDCRSGRSHTGNFLGHGHQRQLLFADWISV